MIGKRSDAQVLRIIANITTGSDRRIVPPQAFRGRSANLPCRMPAPPSRNVPAKKTDGAGEAGATAIFFRLPYRSEVDLPPGGPSF